jgi:hypothetical protein
MVIVSYSTKKPPYAKVNQLTFSLEEFKQETSDLKAAPLKQSYRFWSYLLLAFCVIILIIFW